MGWFVQVDASAGGGACSFVGKRLEGLDGLVALGAEGCGEQITKLSSPKFYRIFGKGEICTVAFIFCLVDSLLDSWKDLEKRNVILEIGK